MEIKIKIVSIDDQSFNLLVIEKLLHLLNFPYPLKIYNFINPLKALDFILKNEIDFIITDYVMPKMDGLELLKHVRAVPKYSSIPIVVVTAKHERELMYECLDKGATDFLTRPIDKLEFIPKIKNLLSLKISQKLLEDRVLLLREEIKKATKAIKQREREIIKRLSTAAEYKDAETGHHIERVALYTKLIAEKIGLSEDKVEILYLASPLHDVGKVAIPDEILKKQDRLSPEEWEIMKKHTIYGYNLLKDSNIELLNVAAEIALYHHERWDGKGYPYGLKEEAIPLSARIVAIADVFDALTGKRIYKQRWSDEEAFSHIKAEKGRHFDPYLTEIFISHKDEVLEIKNKFTD